MKAENRAPRLLFVVNDPAFFVSHRLPLGVAAKDAGFEVLVATAPGGGEAEIADAGLSHLSIPISRSGTNPLAELWLLWAIARLYRSVRPDLVHLVTIKPVLYGGLAARCFSIPGLVSAISGMGYLFASQRRTPVKRVVELLYRAALGHPNSRVVVQNHADREELRRMGALRDGQDTLVAGSGVDLAEYTAAPLPDGQPLVVLPARMLWDKGVREFVEAAEHLTALGIRARFALVGPHDPGNPSAVPAEQLERWRDAGPVEWWGRRDDMPQVLARASLVVLPSFYREGVPKALLEAAAAGRAIVTTDTAGCRDVVEPGKNGLLVAPRDAFSLADAMAQLLVDPERLEAMGRYSRLKAEAEFGIERVVAAHLEIYRTLLENSRPSS